jgi:hypothetical protein
MPARRKIAVLIAAGVIMAASPAEAAGEPALFTLVDILIVSPPVDHAAVERLTGAKLEMDYSGALNDYSAQDVKLGDDLTIAAILYREPVPGRGSMAGSLLELDPGGSCIALASVMARYPGLSATGDAIAHSRDEQTYYSRPEEWGKLSFGFPGNTNRCLKSVSFTLRPQDQTPSRE